MKEKDTPVNSSKSIKDYLPFYLGCKIKIDEAPSDGGIFNKTSIIEYGKTYILGAYELHNIYINDEILKVVKPILRPLSDMTEEEKSEVRQMLKQNEFDIFFFDNTIKVAEYYKWLLSKHFDLFNLIEAGLAIDATKTKEG